jgi:hypothetical protein
VQNQAETTGHILWGCPAAKAIWSMCRSSKIQKRSFEHEDFLAILSDLMRVLDQDDLERVAVVARAVWFRRNAVVHGRQLSQPHVVVSQTLENLEAFQQATSRQRNQVVAVTPTVKSMASSSGGFCKDQLGCGSGLG